ncbi:molybdopterin-dependent oxidoreductase [Pseudonocardia humida]|uniref:Molybdopterin-dependent oxidoreductase n=1 Tax=Pseudonocardia humida TaxID=2800819 RepID=A0ABT1A1E7_9PSEU|nr:molybdopterin-dependent oxidoreductase [Pseudonocardia humida]MCO1656714.1 molybdopterin-dependent oxidoreductase [Pseudonocardia humida]
MGQASAPRRLGRAHVVAVLVALCAVSACATSAPVPTGPVADAVDPAPAVLAPPVLAPGQPVPAPAEPAVLRMLGRIGTTNDGSVLAFDPPTLDLLGRVRVTVYEPWVKQTLNFEGVWLSDLLDVARADPQASTLHLTALDDYQVDLAVADVRAGGVLLATRSGGGAPIPLEDGGPTRIVFAAGVPAGASADQWIWSLSTIDVR